VRPLTPPDLSRSALAWCVVLACLSAWQAGRQTTGDVIGYQIWIKGPLPSWQQPGPYPALVDVVWWPLRWVHGNVNVFWVLGWTAPATVLACVILWRTAARPRAAVGLWLLAAALLERSYWLKLEPLAAVMVLGALVAVRNRRTALSGLLLSLAAMIKVWPALVAPLVAGTAPSRSRFRWSVWFAVPWVTLVAVAAIWQPPAVTTWLTFAATRRIQVESLTALGPLWAIAAGDHSWHIEFAQGLDWTYLMVGPWLDWIHLAVEVVGLTVLDLVGLRYYRYVRAGRGTARAVDELQTALYLQLVILLVVICAGAVFSPQYLFWVAPVLVVAVGGGLLRRESLIWLLGCLLTTATYPILHDGVVNAEPPALIVLTARDAVIVWLLAVCLRNLWRLTAPTSGEPALTS